MEAVDLVEELTAAQMEAWAESWESERHQVAEARGAGQGWWVGVAADPSSDPQRAGRGEAAGLGNTAPGNRQSDQWQTTGGVDFLEVTVFGWQRLQYDETAKLLEQGRQAALGRKGRRVVDVFAASLYMREKGHRWVNDFLPWVGEYDGITISFAKPGVKANGCVAKIQIGSLKLMRDGHRAAWEHALRILDACGVAVDRTTVSRIDFCADLGGVDVTPFVEAIVERRYVTRARRARLDRGDDDGWTGCSVGTRSSCLLRIYDKVAELAVRSPAESSAKREALIQRRWGCDQQRATRGEFQCNGAWLRDRWSDCSTVEQVFDSIGAILEYLCNSFFRITTLAPDREHGHQQRSGPSPEWQQMAEAFRWSESIDVPLRKLEKRPVDRKRCDDRLRAAAMALATTLPGVVVDRESFIQAAVDSLVRTLLPEWELTGELNKRRDTLRASGQDALIDFGPPPRYSPGWVCNLQPECEF